MVGKMTERIAIIGAGVMGAAIAQTLATAGVSVRLTDLSATQLEEARRIVVEGRFGWKRATERGKISAEDAGAAQGRLSFTGDMEEALEGSDMVIEAIPEIFAAKLRLFRRLGELAGPEVTLVSNTSGFPIVALAEVAGRPERTIGWHWASPAQIRPFAEVVRTDQTMVEVVQLVVDLAIRCGKHPVVINENAQVWGFVANRILMAAVHEAQRVADEGLATREEIDQLVCDAYGWPAGPFRVLSGASDGWGDQRQGSVEHLVR
jgi:3-hydroxybutyryl-CoA dehydrogenase